MRVIAGVARSIKLDIPNDKVRPTTDRTKETLFNIIALKIPGSNILDLFAGSGALGIESLSRGAKSCIFVDNYIDSIECIKNNLHRTKLIEKGTILKYDYTRACKEFEIKGEKFDIIFLDPPYNMNLESEALMHIYEKQLLSSEGIVVIESDISTKVEMDLFSDLTIYKEKTFKTNRFTFIKKSGFATVLS